MTARSSANVLSGPHFVAAWQKMQQNVDYYMIMKQGQVEEVETRQERRLCGLFVSVLDTSFFLQFVGRFRQVCWGRLFFKFATDSGRVL
jgi:hypothetical protein